ESLELKDGTHLKDRIVIFSFCLFDISSPSPALRLSQPPAPNPITAQHCIPRLTHTPMCPHHTTRLSRRDTSHPTLSVSAPSISLMARPRENDDWNS
ncbi:hypothetical protein PO909_002072, partial [Leuciscus waleckii]